MSDAYDRAAEFLDRAIEDGLVSAEGQTCGEGVTYEAQPLREIESSYRVAGGPGRCEDPECWCHQEGVQAEVDVAEAIRSDGFTIRRIEEDGTLGEPIEGIVSFEAFHARMTPDELVDLADCRDRIPSDYTAFHQQDVVPDE